MKLLLLLFSILTIFVAAAQPDKTTIKKFKIKKVTVSEVYDENAAPSVSDIFYDENGNDTATLKFGKTEHTKYSYDSKNRIIKKETFGDDWSPQKTFIYTYSPDGTYQVVDTDVQFQLKNTNWYDKKEKLVKSKIPDGTVYTYSYDGKGNMIKVVSTPRTGKASLTTIKYQLDKAGRIIKKNSSGGSTEITYDEKGLPLTMVVIFKGNGDMPASKSTYTYKYE